MNNSENGVGRELILELIRGYARCVRVFGAGAYNIGIYRPVLETPRKLEIFPYPSGRLVAVIRGNVNQGCGGITESRLDGDFILSSELTDGMNYVLHGRPREDGIEPEHIFPIGDIWKDERISRNTETRQVSSGGD